MVKTILNISIIVLFIPISCFATDYYVNVTIGNDKPTCGQKNTPCKSIKQAVQLKQDGEAIIKVAAGTYIEDEIAIIDSSAAPNHVTIEGGWNTDFTSNSGIREQTRILTGNKSSSWDTLFHAWASGGANQPISLTLKCLTIKYEPTGGITQAIYLRAQSSGVAELTLDNVHITGFFVLSDTVITVFNNGSNNVSLNILHSLIDHNSGYNISAYNIIYIIASNTGDMNLTIKKSSILDNGNTHNSHIGLFIDSRNGATIDTTLENTIIAGNISKYDASGVLIQADDTSKQTVTFVNSTITENTCANGGCGLNIVGYNSSQVHSSMRNTILYNNHSANAPDDLYLVENDSAVVSFSGNYNILGDYATYGSPEYTSNNEINTDPELDSRYHLKKGSPAIDAGICGINPFYYIRLAPYEDIDDDKRPGYKQEGCDIGADEYRAFAWPIFLPAIIRKPL